MIFEEVELFEPSKNTGDEMSSVQKLGVPVFFLTITAVYGSLRSSRKQGKREPANSPNTSLSTNVIWYLRFAEADNYQ